MEFSVQNVYGFLIRSRLLTPEAAKAAYHRWHAEAGNDAAELPKFMRWLVTNQYVTEYQASLLARGMADNFFLGDYKILDRLGHGGMAGVFKAVHTLGQVVAIKVLPPSRAKDPNHFARFQREAQLALRLKHPNVVRAFQVGEANGLHFIVMEYLEGETLDEVLARRGRLPPPEAVRLAYQALMGLQHIHEQGLIHRDLKPSNLMLVPAAAAGLPDNTLQATVKILDIGLGRALFDESVLLGTEEQQLTTEGALLGTPDYLAPEQARNAHGVDIRADIYSLGCVLYECLAGRPPFPDTNVITQMVRHLTETPRPLQQFNPEVPDGLQQIVGWMLAKKPDERYPTPERAAQALQTYLAAGSAPLRSPETDPKARLYLSWLEQAGDGSEAGLRRPAPEDVRPGRPAAIASSQAAPPATVAMQRPTAKPAASASVKRRHKKSRPAAQAAAPPPATPNAAPRPAEKPKPTRPAPAAEAAAPVFDVELVPVELPKPPEPLVSVGRLHLTRRDFIMLGAGAGGCGVAIGLGFAAARLVGRLMTPSPTPPEE